MHVRKFILNLSYILVSILLFQNIITYICLPSFCTDNWHDKYVAGRYVAPEVLRNEEYDTKVDVFSFALILQEVKVLLCNILYSCATMNCKVKLLNLLPEPPRRPVFVLIFQTFSDD
jgi:hypothetical protein